MLIDIYIYIYIFRFIPDFEVCRFCCSRYFDDDEEDNADDLEYLPAPGSPTLGGKAGPQKEEESDDSDDPLDAFMAGIEVGMLLVTNIKSGKVLYPLICITHVRKSTVSFNIYYTCQGSTSESGS